MKLADLGRGGRSPGLPLRLRLPEGELELCQWLRVLPNQRYVALAKWQGRLVLAKLLVGRKAARHYLREREGTERLTQFGFATPVLLNAGYCHSAGGWLLFDYLDGAITLSNKWLSVAAQPPLTVTQETVLGAALAALGALHAKGLWQDDLHLDNLLCYENKLFWVDVGSIRNGVLGRPLALGQVLANLGVFFAQLPANFDPFAGQLLEYYERGGGMSCLPITVLQNKVSKIRYARLNDFITKTGRDCSLFSVRRGPMELRAVCRNEVDSLQSLLADPDQFISHGQILKDGGSATVARVSVGDKVVVVKRYNIKGLGHWLRRFWRPTRALHAWRQAHLLIFLGVTTSQPLAMLERRCCWLRGCAYLVTEYLPGENILARFASHVNGAPPPAELTALERLFATLIRERISHGDLKGSNLIWHDGGWALIDLDATRHHKTSYGFARAYTRDRTRLLKNWPVESPLRRVLEARIPQFRP